MDVITSERFRNFVDSWSDGYIHSHAWCLIDGLVFTGP